MENQEKSDARERGYTVWVMKGRTAEPVQYRVSLRALGIAAGLAASLAAVFLVLLPLALIFVSLEYSSLKRESRSLAETAAKYRISEDQLCALSDRVDAFEKSVSDSCRRTGQVIEGLESELSRWIPKGAVGGAEDDEESGAETPEDSFPLSRSQIEQINEIQLRLSRLEGQIESYETTVSDLEGAWEERNSVFSAFPSLWPVKGGRVTSKFGMRIHPISRKLQMHDGIDIIALRGTPIRASAPGMVTFVGRRSGYGKTVVIDHGYGLSTFYAHCNATYVRVGQQVKKGRKIAEVGSTGHSTGPHLHFEVRVRGIQVDPMQYLSLPSPETEE
jgi:murein DD-endopeptidase MepM/ murein hydrolase activator NlpD